MPSSSHSARAASTTPSSNTRSISISGTIRCRRAAGGVVAVIEDAVDAVDQPFEGGSIELIGAAETMHHVGLASLGVGVPDALGEGVVGDGRAVAVLPLGDAQIHASRIARFANFATPTLPSRVPNFFPVICIRLPLSFSR